MKKLHLFFIGMLMVYTCTSQTVSPGNLLITTDQDFLLLLSPSRNEDRNYTQGNAFTITRPDMALDFSHYPQKTVSDLLEKITDNTYTPVSGSISLLGTAFTPLKIDSINPIIGDRPFAFLLAIATTSTFMTNLNWENANTVYHTFSIHYGLFGTEIGYKFQSFAHTHLKTGRPADPFGWKTQISQGGRFTALIGYNRLQTLLDIPVERKKNNVNSDRSLFDLSANVGGTFGYYDRVYTSIALRLGRLQRDRQVRWNTASSSIANANYMAMTPEIDDSSTCQPQLKCKFLRGFARGEQFLFFSSTVSAMFRNSMLEGQKYGSDQYRMLGSWTRTGIFEFEYGLVINIEIKSKGKFPNQTYPISFVFKQVSRSPEFYSGIFPPRWHHFGSASIMLPLEWMFNTNS